jgi:predicted DsbA family dithiol-disulfide isomerase
MKLSKMSSVGVARTLPRFLLPKLSWQTTTTPYNAIRALSTAAPKHDSYKKSRSIAGSRPLIQSRQNGSVFSASNICQSPSIRRAFHATAPRSRDHHFDTLKFVQRLQEEGFTEAQAVAMMKVLSDVIEERYLD